MLAKPFAAEVAEALTRSKFRQPPIERLPDDEPARDTSVDRLVWLATVKWSRDAAADTQARDAEGLCQLAGIPLEVLPEAVIPPMLILDAGKSRSEAASGAASQAAVHWGLAAANHPGDAQAAEP